MTTLYLPFAKIIPKIVSGFYQFRPRLLLTWTVIQERGFRTLMHGRPPFIAADYNREDEKYQYVVDVSQIMK